MGTTTDAIFPSEQQKVSRTKLPLVRCRLCSAGFHADFDSLEPRLAGRKHRILPFADALVNPPRTGIDRTIGWGRKTPQESREWMYVNG